MSETAAGLPAMLITGQVARALRCAQWTIQRTCRESQIPGAVKIFNDRRLIAEEVVASLLGGE